MGSRVQLLLSWIAEREGEQPQRGLLVEDLQLDAFVGGVAFARRADAEAVVRAFGRHAELEAQHEVAPLGALLDPIIDRFLKRVGTRPTRIVMGTAALKDPQFALAACRGADAVRLVTGDRRPPLIFDDPFVTLDDARATRALDLLREIARDFQVIYLTTSDRYHAAADSVVAELDKAMADVE